MRTARSAQRLPYSAVWASEGAKIIGKFTFQVRPTGGEIRVLVAMWFIRDVICLADVSRSGIVLTIPWIVAQRLHAFFGTFFSVWSVIVSISYLQPDPLEFVRTRVSTISAFQSSLKWLIRLVWWGVNTHDIPGPSADLVPSVGIGIRTKCLDCSSMWTSERTEIIRKLLLEFVPATGKVRILIEMRP